MNRISIWKKKSTRIAAYFVAVITLLGIAAFILLYHIDQQVIFSFDEGRHGVTAYEMYQNNEFIMSTNRGVPDFYNLKPPLSFWAIMLGYKLFGFTVFGFRFQCIASIFLMFVIVTWWMYKRHGALGSLVALAFLVANIVYFERTSDADEIYWLISTVSLLCMLDSDRDIRWLYGSALCFGFAFLAKSYHAVLIPIVCILYIVSTGKLKKLKPKNYLMLIALGLLPIIPWAVARYMRDGMSFFAAMLKTDVVERVGAAGSPWYFYLADLADNPSVIIAAITGTTALAHKMIKGDRLTAKPIGLLIWMILPVALFSLVTFKLYHYIYPIMSAVAISGALAVMYWVRYAPKNRIAAGCVLAVGLALLFPIISNINYAMHRENRGSYQTALSEMFDRDMDSGLHVYIQADRTTSVWAQCDILCAIMSGDVLCLDGGVDAFEQDVDPAVVVIDNTCLDSDLLGNYPVYYDSHYLTALSN